MDPDRYLVEGKGRKTIAFWTLLVLISMLALGNLILTITILSVLNVTGQGMETVETSTQFDLVKFSGQADLGHVYKRDGLLEGFLNRPIHFEGDRILMTNSDQMQDLQVDENGTVFHGIDHFLVENSEGKTIFQADQPHFHQVSIVNELDSDDLEVSQIRGPLQDSLTVEGRNSITLKGNEGGFIDGKTITIKADQDILLKSEEGLVFNSGLKLDLKRIPVIGPSQIKGQIQEYKLCVSRSKGLLFRVPNTQYCK